jgi:rhodanese-related sulfurtransferase
MRRLALILAFAFGLNSVALADEDTPSTLDGARIITAEDLRSILTERSVRIYDLRKKASYVEGHVPNAINAAPHYNEKEKTIDMGGLEPDRNARIVFYSHGVTGWKSYFAAKTAVASGYRNVMWMRGGYAEWEDKNLPIAR